MTDRGVSIEERLSPCLEWIFAEPDAIEDRVALAALHGLRQVEFWYWRRRDVNSLRDALRERGVGVSAVVVDPQADIADVAAHPVWLSNVKDSALVAERLESPVLVATAGLRLEPGPPDREQMAAVSEALAVAASIAQSHGVKIALEPLNDRVDHPGTLLTSSQVALEVVEAIGSPALGILLDVYHAHAMGEDVPAMIGELGEHIVHVQVADDPGRNEPGSGNIPWAKVIQALHGINYQGNFGLEYKPTMPSAESVSFATRTLIRAATGTSP
ncbi:MAG TPA: TIM barrel protein [Acidimicrobiales bacterium]|nr:TIM barrel protein [Acidimicrobiales bacterium]